MIKEHKFVRADRFAGLDDAVEVSLEQGPSDRRRAGRDAFSTEGRADGPVIQFLADPRLRVHDRDAGSPAGENPGGRDCGAARY